MRIKSSLRITHWPSSVLSTSGHKHERLFYWPLSSLEVCLLQIPKSDLTAHFSSAIVVNDIPMLHDAAILIRTQYPLSPLSLPAIEILVNMDEDDYAFNGEQSSSHVGIALKEICKESRKTFLPFTPHQNANGRNPTD